jgi:hypothetical protein
MSNYCHTIYRLGLSTSMAVLGLTLYSCFEAEPQKQPIEAIDAMNICYGAIATVDKHYVTLRVSIPMLEDGQDGPTTEIKIFDLDGKSAFDPFAQEDAKKVPTVIEELVNGTKIMTHTWRISLKDNIKKGIINIILKVKGTQVMSFQSTFDSAIDKSPN